MKRNNYSFTVLVTVAIFLITPLLMDVGVNAQPDRNKNNVHVDFTNP
jgi:hypothetical protein